ncbi:MAG: hypothetical protein AVDCRST_MAG53-1156 [uncultured Solirubrobacteraceae bacterium]|uniref:Histidine kinase/HSP90-like ATPase domain-containing protein n=1 Tax=uncultured Solirubrobacteraceae bacterium TaxID=1162706 RepID=A0A6J4SAH4_9ACTN|nr:MAG: hypothetical protein AVDCRST_MAG53-1156 [uncultured Solirubrobacteraceae bacterium]
MRRAAVQFAAAHNVEDPPINALRLALAEAVNNTVVHAYAGGGQVGSVTVAVDVEFGDREVCIRVTDHGRGMGPRVDSPGLGLGLPLMSTLADTVNVRAPAASCGTEVAMSFKLGADDALG